MAAYKPIRPCMSECSLCNNSGDEYSVSALSIVLPGTAAVSPTQPDLANASVVNSRLILVPLARVIIQVDGDLTGPKDDPCWEECNLGEGVVEVIDACAVPGLDCYALGEHRRTVM
jgi:hypothetical protein